MSKLQSIPERERGAALLTVLLLVAVMGAISAAALQKLSLATSLAVNSASTDQARGFAIGVESLLALTIDDLSARSPNKTTLAGSWNGAKRTYPLPGGGFAEATVHDGGNCFNLNSLVEASGPDTFVTRPTGVAQLIALLRLLEAPEGTARRIAEGAADWADTDTNPNREGAEDSHYAGAKVPYRSGNVLFAEVSELRAVAGVTPEVYDRARPFLCALPVAELSPLNVNTLTPAQAPLLAMLVPSEVTLDEARRILMERPQVGWESQLDFWNQPQLEGLIPPLDVQLQPQLRTAWFALELHVAIEGAELFETALVDARRAPSRIVVRRWGSEA